MRTYVQVSETAWLHSFSVATEICLKEIRQKFPTNIFPASHFNPFNVELNPICLLLALFVAHHILHISR